MRFLVFVLCFSICIVASAINLPQDESGVPRIQVVQTALPLMGMRKDSLSEEIETDSEKHARHVREEAVSQGVMVEDPKDRYQRQKERAQADRKLSFEKYFFRIGRPEDAQNFIENFRDMPDPNGLLSKAEARGYREGVVNMQRCIDNAHGMIAQQNAIAREVGLVDKAVMYRAGQALVTCKANLVKWQKMVKK